MINVGKYMAAAKGGPNMVAKNAASEAPLLLKRTAKPRHPGTMAGYEGGKSAYVQMNGSGYMRRPRREYFVPSSGVNAYSPGRSSTISRTNLRKADLSRVTGDQDLSRLL